MRLFFVLVFFLLSLKPLEVYSQVHQEEIQKIIDEAHHLFKNEKGGKNANYIKSLENVPSRLFGIAVVTTKGDLYTVGDVDYPFSIQSISKVFTTLLVMQQQGEDIIVNKIGVEPTGMPFGSVMALELQKTRTANPMVNAGAISTVSLIKADNAEERFEKILSFYNSFAGKKLHVIDEVYKEELIKTPKTHAIANLLLSYKRIYSDPMEAVDVFIRQCSVAVTAKQLAIMGSTLANGGKNPFTGDQLVRSEYISKILAVMMVAGFYDESGKWTWNTGVPAKTGVGGGILAIVPNKMAIVAFSPRLNEAGNSVRATKAVRYVVDKLKLNLFNATSK